jgi:hypothetical protein
VVLFAFRRRNLLRIRGEGTSQACAFLYLTQLTCVERNSRFAERLHAPLRLLRSTYCYIGVHVVPVQTWVQGLRFFADDTVADIAAHGMTVLIGDSLELELVRRRALQPHVHPARCTALGGECCRTRASTATSATTTSARGPISLQPSPRLPPGSSQLLLRLPSLLRIRPSRQCP